VRRFDKRIPFFKGRQQRPGVLHDHPGKENYLANKKLVKTLVMNISEEP
jgi:hypothetical protein